jgi:hypothetical protein
MNLNNNPTKQQLRDLTARMDDRAGSHVIWVTKQGEVVVTCVPFGSSLDEFVQAHPEMQMYYETFEVGMGYMGEEAAADDEWIDELFDNLLTEWAKARAQPEARRAELVL